MKRGLGLGAVVGGVIYAVAGAVMAARNLRWFGWSPNANPLMVWLGLGLALVVLAFAVVHGADIWSRGSAGRIATVAGIAVPVTLLASGVIEFAIFGTLLTFVAFVSFTVMVHRRRLLPKSDVALLYVATVASITWNTETPSAALLVVVGVVAGWISFHALLVNRWAVGSQAAMNLESLGAVLPHNSPQHPTAARYARSRQKSLGGQMNASEGSANQAEQPPASASAAERYLSAWHGRHPDAGRLFADDVDAEGQSSLERLAADAESASAVVDVGCGSGRLLQLCHRSNPSAQQIGIDVNHADLHIAAELLPGVRFVQARAQALPLRADRVDCVLCHMALMLMDDPSQVLAEVNRVLRPGGIFAAVIHRHVSHDARTEAVFAALRPLIERADSTTLPPPMGDSRTTDEGALRALAVLPVDVLDS